MILYNQYIITQNEFPTLKTILYWHLCDFVLRLKLKDTLRSLLLGRYSSLLDLELILVIGKVNESREI